LTHRLFDFLPAWLDSMASAVAAGLLAALGLFLIGQASNVIFHKRAKEIGGAMGFGDVKLMILLGVMLGWPKLVAAFFVAILLGAVFGSVQLIRKKGHGMPFGPYLAFGAITAALAMPALMAVVNWYLGLLEGLVE
jgi:prepilin signal peptidase PulO-like enzyme (type II secretory pathway)